LHAQVFYRGIEVVSAHRSSQTADDLAAEGATSEVDEPQGGNENGEDRDDEQAEPEDDAHEVSKELSDVEMAERCRTLIDSITSTVFGYVRRGLFERHKLTVAVLLTLRIAVNDGWLPQAQVDALVNGVSASDPGNMGSLSDWMPPTIWQKIKGIEAQLPIDFKGLGDHLLEDADEWRDWFNDEKVGRAP
jgi:dynein heavy chain